MIFTITQKRPNTINSYKIIYAKYEMKLGRVNKNIKMTYKYLNVIFSTQRKLLKKLY